MAVTFKSNQVANQYIKDVSGYRGPKDFKANVSFADGLVVNDKWEPIAINSVISVSRNSQASVLNSPDLSDYEIIANNVPRISYIPDHKTKGLISSTWASSLLNSTTATGATLTAGDTVYALFTTDEVGSITIADNANVTVLSGTGIFSDPLYFKVSAATSINLVRNNGAVKAHLMIASNGQTPFIPNYEFIGINPDSITLSPSVIGPEQGAVVFKFASPKRKYTGYVGSDQNFPVFLLKQDDNNYVAAYLNAAGKINVRLYENGAQRYFVDSSESINRSNVNTIAISWELGRIKVSVNGANFIPFSERAMSSTFTVNLVKLVGALESWVPIQSDMAIFNIVTYRRALDLQELNVASSY